LAGRRRPRFSDRRRAPPPEDVTALDAALSPLVDVLAAEIRPRAVKAADAPGAGAAGGAGYAAIAVLAATRRPGIDAVLEFTGLADRLAGTPSSCNRSGLQKRRGIPVIAMC
jgi:glycerate kinase